MTNGTDKEQFFEISAVSRLTGMSTPNIRHLGEEAPSGGAEAFGLQAAPIHGGRCSAADFAKGIG